MMSVLKGKKMDKKQVQETYRETTLEEEQEYFEEVENELQCDLQTTQESIDYRNQAIKAQKKYMRDSHGDMDDEEFLQNMNNVNFYRTCGKAGGCTGAPDRESVFWKDCI